MCIMEIQMRFIFYLRNWTFGLVENKGECSNKTIFLNSELNVKGIQTSNSGLF